MKINEDVKIILIEDKTMTFKDKEEELVFKKGDSITVKAEDITLYGEVNDIFEDWFSMYTSDLFYGTADIDIEGIEEVKPYSYA